MRDYCDRRDRIVLAAVLLAAVPAASCLAQAGSEAEWAKQKYRGLLGPDSKKVKKQDGKTFIWAGGKKPGSPEALWYDFTGAEIPTAELQFGIGKDRIRAIDDPVFVSPDDPRLLKLPHSRFRGDKRPKSNDEIMVAGYVVGDDARAYPLGLLDLHELVNDSIGGKPVTVGW